jgi:DNA mismatch repair protein MutS
MLKNSPLKKQYDHIKARYQDAVILFRVGDFYEAFDHDAVTLSELCGTILSKKPDQTQLSWFPSLSLDSYLPLLVKSGKRVAVVDPLIDSRIESGKTAIKSKTKAKALTRLSL